jgi:hypothetical protein
MLKKKQLPPPPPTTKNVLVDQVTFIEFETGDRIDGTKVWTGEGAGGVTW